MELKLGTCDLTNQFDRRVDFILLRTIVERFEKRIECRLSYRLSR